MAYWDRDDTQRVLSKWQQLLRKGHIAPAEHRHALEQLGRAVELELRTCYPHPPSLAVRDGWSAGSAGWSVDTGLLCSGSGTVGSGSNASTAGTVRPAGI